MGTGLPALQWLSLKVNMMKFFKKSKLFTSIFGSFFVISFAPLLYMAIISFHDVARLLEQHIENKLIAISDGRQALLKRTLDDISAFTTERASGPTPVAAFEKLDAAFKVYGVQSEEYKVLDAQYKEAFQRYFDVNDYLYDILFVSIEGNIVFSMLHENDFGQNIYNQPLKNTALAGLIDSTITYLSTSISDFDFYPPSNHPALFIASPVFGKDKLLGALVFQIKPELLYNFAQNYVGLPSTGDVVFAKKAGDDIVYTTPLRFKPDAALNYKVKIGSYIGVPAQKAVRGETGIGFAKDYAGKIVLARWQYIPQLRWGMVIKVSRDEVFQPIYRLRNLYIIVCFILACLLLAVSFVVARHISRPIETIRNSLNVIGTGDLDHKINLKRNDEIGELSGMVDQMTDNLREYREKLIRSERFAALGKLAGFVSHELRNPLGVMKNVLYYLEMLGVSKDNPEVKENLDILSSEIVKSDKIINDLLEFSRVKKPTLQSGNVNTIIDEILSRLEIKPNIKVIKELKADLPNIDLDQLHVHQVFYNIAKNAMEAMDKGGVLKIKTALADNFIETSFSDTGGGIPKENLDKIFQPLFSTKVKGSGLGLAICNMLILGHNGKIDVESEVGKGTTFVVKLPVKRG